MDFEPRDWLFCKGQTLYINQYQALFALIGNRYGGNGTTTFSLSNLSGRVIVGVGQGAGTSDYTLGQIGGTETVALTENQMPAHIHTISASTLGASKSTPGGNAVLAYYLCQRDFPGSPIGTDTSSCKAGSLQEGSKE